MPSLPTPPGAMGGEFLQPSPPPSHLGKGKNQSPKFKSELPIPEVGSDPNSLNLFETFDSSELSSALGCLNSLLDFTADNDGGSGGSAGDDIPFFPPAVKPLPAKLKTRRKGSNTSPHSSPNNSSRSLGLLSKKEARERNLSNCSTGSTGSSVSAEVAVPSPPGLRQPPGLEVPDHKSTPESVAEMLFKTTPKGAKRSLGEPTRTNSGIVGSKPEHSPKIKITTPLVAPDGLGLNLDSLAVVSSSEPSSYIPTPSLPTPTSSKRSVDFNPDVLHSGGEEKGEAVDGGVGKEKDQQDLSTMKGFESVAINCNEKGNDYEAMMCEYQDYNGDESENDNILYEVNSSIAQLLSSTLNDTPLEELIVFPQFHLRKNKMRYRVTKDKSVRFFSDQLSSAVAKLEWFKNLGGSPDMDTYVLLLNGAVRALNMTAAKSIFDEMQSFGIRPNIIAYNTMLCGYCYVGMVDEALAVFENMKADAIDPDLVTYNELIAACFISDKQTTALGLLSLMKTTTVVPNGLTYLITLTGLSMYGEWKQFDRLIEEMEEYHVRLDSLMFVVIFRGTKSADSATALKFLDLAEKLGIQLNSFHGIALERWTKPKWLKDVSVRTWFELRHIDYNSLPDVPPDDPNFQYIVCVLSDGKSANSNPAKSSNTSQSTASGSAQTDIEMTSDSRRTSNVSNVSSLFSNSNTSSSSGALTEPSRLSPPINEITVDYAMTANDPDGSESKKAYSRQSVDVSRIIFTDKYGSGSGNAKLAHNMHLKSKRERKRERKRQEKLLMQQQTEVEMSLSSGASDWAANNAAFSPSDPSLPEQPGPLSFDIDTAQRGLARLKAAQTELQTSQNVQNVAITAQPYYHHQHQYQHQHQHQHQHQYQQPIILHHQQQQYQQQEPQTTTIYQTQYVNRIVPVQPVKVVTNIQHLNIAPTTYQAYQAQMYTPAHHSNYAQKRQYYYPAHQGQQWQYGTGAADRTRGNNHRGVAAGGREWQQGGSGRGRGGRGKRFAGRGKIPENRRPYDPTATHQAKG